MQMNKTAVLGVIVGLIAGNSVAADEDLARGKGCLNCHNVQNKIVGPAFIEVAQKYRGQDVQQQLATKVQKGGGGSWGSLPMPPNALTQDEANKLVTWILNLK